MEFDIYAEKLSMLDLTDKTLKICDDHESLQYKKLLNSRDSSLLWLLENTKDIDFSFPEQNDSVSIVIGEKQYDTQNTNIINRAKQILKKREEKNVKTGIYIPTTEEIENSIEVEQHNNIIIPTNPAVSLDDYNSHYEKQKSCFSFVYTEYEVAVLRKNEETENFKMYLYPLKLYENKLDPECIVVIETGGYEKKRTVITDRILDKFGHAKIRTYFANGKIYGIILPSPDFEFRFEISEPKIHSSLDSRNAYFGHICFECFENIVHVFPYSFNNNEKGYAQCLVMIKKPKSESLTEIECKNGSYHLKTEGGDFQLIIYWQEETLICDTIKSSAL